MTKAKVCRIRSLIDYCRLAMMLPIIEKVRRITCKTVKATMSPIDFSVTALAAIARMIRRIDMTIMDHAKI